jgi:hypothetical protein
MKSFLYILVTVSLLSCSKKETITAEEVAAVISRFDAAWQNKRAAGVDSVVADQYIYFTQSGGVFSRENLIRTAGSAEYQLESSERKLVSVIIHGNSAVVNTTWKGKGSYFGQPFDDYQRCSIALVKISGEVKIVSEHCTVIRP